MARYRGRVGFVTQIDDQETGNVRDEAMEKVFFGKVLEHSRRWQGSDTVTDDLQLGCQIAITGNDFAFRYASAICYCEYMGGFWKVTGIKIKRPEIILTLGGVYNGKRQADPPGGAEKVRTQGLL